MSGERPTPEQVANDDAPGTIGPAMRLAFLDELVKEGYVIVHPDDVPTMNELGPGFSSPIAKGWNACRSSVFGDGA